MLRHALSPARMRVALAFARKEVGGLVGLFIVGAAGFGFMALADSVGEGDTTHFDTMIMMALRQPGNPSLPIGPHWLTILATDVTALGSVTILTLVVAAVAGLFLALREKREALWLIVAAAGGTALSQGFKVMFERPRPPLYMHAVEVMNASFPSGHATLSAVVYLTLGVLVARFAKTRVVKTYAIVCAVIATLLVGCSRVYLGVHWPTDVLAGWSLGSLWAIGIWLAAWVVERRWRGQDMAAGQTPAV